MTITREQVADLQPGDVVELTDERWLGVVVTGPVTASYEHLLLGPVGCLRCPDGTVTRVAKSGTLTVISRAPRPLYVNHDRTEPVPGDVVRDADSEQPETWHYVRMDFGAPWGTTTGPKRLPRERLPARLRLLVDGETGLPPAEQS